ncbi:MarR family winged helix-turn-helix transcriptional regulator [Microbacter sp. GSS18]|nr:MarR family winged helix-turn-helix transcriptional regulator [Microbacter sp. GSS18]
MPRPTTSSVGGSRLARSPLADDLSFLLARANALAVAEANAALAEHGLKVRAFAVLELAAADTRPSQRELADFLRLDPSQVVALVDDLQRRGLVERRPDPEDRRANVVVATADGVRVAAAARVVAEDSERRVHARLSEQERAQLTDMLKRIALDEE